MKKTYILSVLFILFLAGCQTIHEGPVERISNFSIEKEVTQINVLDWQTEETVFELTDTDFIQELIEKLTNADTISTANMDFANPDYKLVFISGEEIVYELGYYKNSMNLGIVGRYWDFQKDGLYGVIKKIPLEE